MIKSLRRKFNEQNAGCTACSCCSLGAFIVALVFFVLLLPEYQFVSSFLQDSCMMYDCGGGIALDHSYQLLGFLQFPPSFQHFFLTAGSCVDRRGMGLCSWNSAANIDRCTLYYNVSVLRVSQKAFFCEFFFALLLFCFSCFITSRRVLLIILLQPRVSSTLMVLNPSLKKEISYEVRWHDSLEHFHHVVSKHFLSVADSSKLFISMLHH